MFKKDESSKKSDQTKETLFRVAVEMIAEKGFDATTMRAIASRAGVAPGATYYYFESKESLVYEYYKKSQRDHEAVVSNFLKTETKFAKRLHRVATSKIELALPYKEMARALYRVAANPESPLSPFSDESKVLRLEALKICENVVNGSKDNFNSTVKKMLPEFLWLYQMGIILFWIYDNSKNSKKTFELIDKTVPLVESLNKMIQSPLAAPFRKKIISVLASFVPDLGNRSSAQYSGKSKSPEEL